MGDAGTGMRERWVSASYGRNVEMRQGDDIVCDKCGKEAFVAKKTIMDGWTKKGEVFVCSACGVELGTAEVADKPSGGWASTKSSDALKAAASALSLEVEDKKRLSATDEEKRFCRDCVNFVSHPFLSRCELHGKDVNPMDDCADFAPKRNGG